MAANDFQCGARGILELPSPLQVELFTKWLTMKDMGKLDSSLCSSTLRAPFIAAWKQQHCEFGKYADEALYLNASLAAWATKRGVNIGTHLRFYDNDALDPDLDRFFRALGSTVRELLYGESPFDMTGLPKLPGRVAGFAEKAGLCSELTKLTLFNVSIEDEDLRKILTNCKKLKHLKYYLTKHVDFEAINKCGQALESVDVEIYRPELKFDRYSQWVPEQSNPSINHPKTNTLRKFRFVETQPTGTWDFLLDFIAANVGLQEVEVDALSWFDLCHIMDSCPELVTLRAYANIEHFDGGWMDDEEDEDIPVLANGGKLLNDDEDIPFLIKNKSIRYLQLCNHDRTRTLFTEEQLLHLIDQCPHYVVLSLSDMYDNLWLSRERALPSPVPAIAPKTSGLQVLHVRTTSISALTDIFEVCPHLKEIGIQDLQTEAVEATVALLMKHQVRRVHLKLAIGQAASALFALTGLDFLHLFNSHDITGEDILVIARNNPHLTHLRIKGCEKVTTKHLTEIVLVCPQLETLYVNAEYDELPELCEKLRKICPSLKHVHLAIEVHKE